MKCDTVSHEIQGWFDYKDYYRSCIERMPDYSVFVEVGVWLGKSLVYAMQYARDVGKRNIKFYAVDTWEGCEEVHYQHMQQYGGPEGLYKQFLRNVRGYKVTVIREPSLEAVKKIENAFNVFIDANHEYASVVADIKAWTGVVQEFGRIGGHDYRTWPSVQRAVSECFRNYSVMGDCWYKDNL